MRLNENRRLWLYLGLLGVGELIILLVALFVTMPMGQGIGMRALMFVLFSFFYIVIWFFVCFLVEGMIGLYHRLGEGDRW